MSGKRNVRLRFGPPGGFAVWDITAIGNHTRAARADPDSEPTLRTWLSEEDAE
jgi:hypothetical protein